MLHHDRENPLYENYDRLLEIAKKYDVTLSLGDGLRPGCLADATDRAQIHELMTLGQLTKWAWDQDVQVMIEGPGHVPLNQIRANILLQKQLCYHAPFYVLGPLVTDIAAGYDHVACAIGGAVAGEAGADFLCYVTPTEHLCLPGVEDVREGVIVTRIAAHAADIARGHKGAIERDRKMSVARKNLDWEAMMELAIDPAKVQEDQGSESAHGGRCLHHVRKVLRREAGEGVLQQEVTAQGVAGVRGRKPARHEGHIRGYSVNLELCALHFSHFPIQNSLKIRSSTSSGVVSPMISPRASSPL